MAGKRIIVFAAFALAALALALSARGGAEAQTYRPFNSYSLTTPGPNSNSAIGFSIAAPDYNYEDASMTILNPVDGLQATGLEAPIGAVVGTLNASVAVGLLGGPCNSALGPNFTLENASVDIADQDNNTSWILKPTSTTIPDDDADQLYNYEEKYPWFLNTMLDPDGTGPLLPLQPRARFAGHTSVAANWVLVQFLVFNPGQMTAMGGIYTQMTAEKGAPSYIVLDNPIGEGEAAPGAIADFCTPLSTITTLNGTTTANPRTGAGAGFIRQTNPAVGTGIALTGTHMAYNYSQSERNIDGDLFENDLDGCRYRPDLATWNPRTTACVPGSNPGDQDCDMLPSSCDPNDGANNTDQDTDGYDNAQDNCPLVANGCKDSSCGPIFLATWDNQDDRDAGLPNADLGPRSDAIGDSCDDSDDDGNEDGAGAGTCNDGLDNGGDTVRDDVDPDCVPSLDKADWPPVPATQPQQGAYYHGYPWAAACVGSTDTDGDGYCDNLEEILGSPANNGPETGPQCTNALDDDGDGYVNDGCPFVGKYAETGAQCAAGNATSDDTPTPDVTEAGSPIVNDGCPVIGVPEGLAIDATMTAAAALPVTAAQSCSDLIDNDDDGTTDAADIECQAAAVGGDQDNDGWADNADVGFDPEIAQDHVGDETVQRDGAMNALSFTYNRATGVIKIGNAGGGCWIIRPANIDWIFNGPAPDGDLEAIAVCLGSPRGVFRRVNLDGSGNTVNEDGDSTADDGCAGGPAAVGVSEAADHCYDSVDSDGDTTVDDGCPGGPPAGGPGLISEGADWCAGGDTDIDIYWIKFGLNAGDPTGTDNCPTVWNPTQTNTDAGFAATTGFPAGDDLGDACDPDDDADGFTDVVEAHLPTDPLDRCSNGAAPNKSDTWGLDQNLDKQVSVVGDVLKYSGKIGASVITSPPTSWAISRLDLNRDNQVSVVGDVLKYSGKIGSTCT